MAPWSSKKAGQGQISHDGTAAAVNSASSSSNGKEAKDEFESSKPSSAAVNRSTSCSPKKRKKQEQHHPDVPVKLSRPPLSFLFAIFLNQFYINLIVLVPRQVGIYIIRQRFLPQDDPAAQMTAGVKYGTLMSATNFAQLAASYFWGWASDVTGRKPLLLLSNVVSGAASAWFVSTRTFNQGLASRALSGCFMCSGVVLKAMIGIHYTKHGQAIAMAWRTLGAGVGQIATPLIIASLSDPCKLYGSGPVGRSSACQPAGFLRSDPFVLCGFFTVFVGVIATLTNWFLVPRDPPKEWVARLRAKLRRGRRKEGGAEAAARAAVGAGAARAAAATGVAAPATAKIDGGDGGDGGGSSSSSADINGEDEDERAGGVTGDEDALATLLSVLSLPPQPVFQHQQPQQHISVASDVENNGSSAPAAATTAAAAPATAPAAAGASSRPSATSGPRGRHPVVPSSVFLAQAQESRKEAADAVADAVTGGSSLGRRAAARSAAAATASSAESSLGRRLSAAATSFGVFAIAAGDYCNTINDVDTARTAAAVARQQNTQRQQRRATSSGLSRPSAAAFPPLSSVALSSAKPSTVSSSMKKDEDGEKDSKAGNVGKAAGAALAETTTTTATAATVPWWRCRPTLVAIFAFATTTMLNESVLDLYQFYATSSPCAAKGDPPLVRAGLCLDVTKTSLTVSVGGAGVVAFSLLGYPPLQKKFGVAAMCRFGLLVGALMCLMMAAARHAYPLGIGPLLAVLVGAQLLYGVGFSATSTASMIMVNLCAPAGQVGAVNGAANLLMSASRIIGPYIVGASWDAVEKSMKLDQWFPFGLFSGLFAATLAGYVLLGVSDAGLD